MIGNILGIRVHIEVRLPRYTLPDDVPPPTGMTRAEFDEWSRRVCGYRPSLLTTGQVARVGNDVYMNDATFDMIKKGLSNA